MISTRKSSPSISGTGTRTTPRTLSVCKCFGRLMLQVCWLFVAGLLKPAGPAPSGALGGRFPSPVLPISADRGRFPLGPAPFSEQTCPVFAAARRCCMALFEQKFGGKKTSFCKASRHGRTTSPREAILFVDKCVRTDVRRNYMWIKMWIKSFQFLLLKKRSFIKFVG